MTSGDKNHVPEAAKNPEMEQYLAQDKSEFEGLDFNSIDFVGLTYSADTLTESSTIVIAGSDKVQDANRDFKFRNIRVISIKENKEVIKTNYLSTSGFGDFTNIKYVWLNNKTSGYLACTDTGQVIIYPFEKRIENEVEIISAHFSGIT